MGEGGDMAARGCGTGAEIGVVGWPGPRHALSIRRPDGMGGGRGSILHVARARERREELGGIE